MSPTSGQFDISHSVVAGGGGTSTNANYKVDGTIGQATAGTAMSGGQFSQTGGFWAAESATPSVSPSPTPSPTPTPPPSNLQFSASNYTVNEGAGFIDITVTRTAETTATVTVDFETNDLGAEQRTDYTIAAGTLTFAPGEISKTFSVLIVDDVYVEGSEVLNLTLSNPTGGGVLVSPSTATLTITDNDSISATTNPLDNAHFFAQQHFYDFLSRYPDSGGWDFWTGQITQCGTDLICLRTKRVDVSNAFFYELEYQQTGAYTFRLYRAAFGNNQPFSNPDNSNQTEAKKLPSYNVFAHDRARVIGGADLATGQLNLANGFVQRPEFLVKYPANQDGPTSRRGCWSTDWQLPDHPRVGAWRHGRRLSRQACRSSSTGKLSPSLYGLQFVIN
jgi:hypothetical protein